MAVVRRVGPGSAFKIGLVLYGVLGLFLGIIFAFISMVGGALSSMASAEDSPFGVFKFAFGIGAIVFFPLFYGIIGGVFAALGAAIYNLVAGRVGGLEVDIS